MPSQGAAGGTPGDRSEARRLADAVAALQELDTPGLRRRWRQLLGKPLASDLGRPLILRVLTYMLQAQRLGDLDKVSARALAMCAGPLVDASAKDTGSIAPMSSDNISREDRVLKQPNQLLPRLVQPGSLLVREYGGILHRVMVLEDGVSWNGAIYESLSKVAFAITGTKWNGPRFFGLRERSSAKGQGALKPTSGNAVIGRGRVAPGRTLQRFPT